MSQVLRYSAHVSERCHLWARSLLSRSSVPRRKKMSAGAFDGRLTRDVLLYEHDNVRFWRRARSLAALQLVVSCNVSFWTYRWLKIGSGEADECSGGFWNNSYASMLACAIIIASNYVGLGVMLASRRSVSALVLRKRGQVLDIVTSSYSRKTYSVPVGKVGLERQKSDRHLSLQVKDTTIGFRINMLGKFHNRQLLQSTLGSVKSWMK